LINLEKLDLYGNDIKKIDKSIKELIVLNEIETYIDEVDLED
jgi:Leucine-rich repeat (LRR) protein